MGQGVATKKFESPAYCHYFLDGDRIVLIPTKGGLPYFLEFFCRDLSKGFQITCGMPPFFGN